MIERLVTFLKKVPGLIPVVKFFLQPFLKHRDAQNVAAYQDWLAEMLPTNKMLEDQRETSKELAYRPCLSIVVPVYDTPEVFLHDMVKSVLAQTYDNWELLLVDDASPNQKIREILADYAQREGRIKPVYLTENHHIAGATNEGIKVANGEFISLLDHDDLLAPDALFEVANLLASQRSLDFIYTDEDKIIDSPSTRRDPLFKPSWNPDFLRSVNYITHFTTIRKSVLDTVGYENGEYNGAQDWELFLRITRSIPVEHIAHIPKVLYSWRIHDVSTAKDFSSKPYVVESQRKAIEADLMARSEIVQTVVQDDLYSAQWNIIRSRRDTPHVTILLEGESSRFEDYIKAHTNYSSFTIQTIVENSDYKNILASIKSEFIVFISTDNLAIRDKYWMGAMMGDAERSDIGFVVARDDTFLNERMTTLLSDDRAHFAATLPRKSLTKHLYATTRYNIESVERGVIMVEVAKLQRAAAGDSLHTLEDLSKALTSAGYYNLYNPYVKMVN